MQQKEITIDYKNGKAAALYIPKNRLKDTAPDSLSILLQVRIAPGTPGEILGTFEDLESNVRFTPVVPFTPGLKYTIHLGDILIDSFSIPLSSVNQSPRVTAVYPSGDTLPENLLKLTIQFSAPMQEGIALKHIYLLQAGDTLQEVFLDLQPELWNKEATALTLWLDPGRIKRDLQPNKRLGNPLVFGKRYTLEIDGKWKSAAALSLAEPYKKTFVVGAKDSLPPDMNKWNVYAPKAQTSNPLVIEFGESLDYFLALETINIIDNGGNTVAGTIRMDANEIALHFTPTTPWKKGNYLLKADAILEDLAGNNLNKPFDRDLLTTPAKTPKDVYERVFYIE